MIRVKFAINLAKKKFKVESPTLKKTNIADIKFGSVF